MNEAKEPIKIYLDEQTEPFKVDHPPLRFPLSTLPLADGDHVLRVEASNGLAPPTIKEIPFRVRNGVAVTVSGLEPNQTIGGQVELIVNAYAGNTEVDFEPRRAETPQPIPTWAWVLALGIMVWSLFYILNPVQPPRDAAATTFDVGRELGERLYMDTCARCHGEDGRGRVAEDNPDNELVKKLRDTPRLALDESPYKLLFKVVTGTRSPDIRMPAWGPILTNEEIVAVVNFVRTSWGHDASQINPRFRRPPPGVEKLERDILEAMKNKDLERMSFCCWPERVRPQLYRIDGGKWAVGRDEVLTEWQGYFEALDTSKVVNFQLTDVRYDYEPESIDEINAYVFAMGRIFLSTEYPDGRQESDTGRFIRVYLRVKNGTTRPDGTPGSQWALLFDFANIRMRVGCAVEEDCPPGQEPGGRGGHSPNGTDPDDNDPEGTDPKGRDPDGSNPAGSGASSGVGYAEIQALLAGLNADAGDAGHMRFWEEPYQDFIELEFPFSYDNVDETVKLLEVGNSKESNIIRAFTDGKQVKVKLENGDYEYRDINRMPKGKGAMTPEQIAILAKWIDAGCPEFATGGGGKPPSKDDGPKDEPKKTEPKKDQPKKAEPSKDDEPKKSATGPAAGPIVGYAEIQAILAGLNADAGDAGHMRFWEESYKDFIELEFPFSFDNVDETVKLLEVGNSAASNIIKALTDGKGLKVKLEDGSFETRDIKRMPKGKGAMDAEQVATIARWIDAGCPEVAPAPGEAPAKGAPAKDAPKKAEAEKAAPVKDAPKDEPKKSAAVTSELGFEEVVRLFKRLRFKAPNAPHSNFWKELDYQEFIGFSFPLKFGKPGSIKLLVPYDSAASNMIKAFKDGKGVTLDMPDGTTKVVDINPMPKDEDPLEPDFLKQLEDWIDAGCPEFAGKPSALPRPGGAPSAAPAAGEKPAEAPAPAGGDGFPAPKGDGK